MKFWIHYNTERPYSVEMNTKNVIIKTKSDKEIVFDEDVKRIWLGNPKEIINGKIKYRKGLLGHIVLIERKNGKYILVERGLFEFKSPEPILAFRSVIHGLDVFTAWAKTKTKGIFLNREKKGFRMLPLKTIKNWKGPFLDLYNHKATYIPIKTLHDTFV